jgi:Domain of unknown function (DUF1737)
MTTLLHYQVVAKPSIEELNQKVTELLRANWQISGSPVVCVSPVPQNASSINNFEKVMYYQALVKGE